MAEGLYETPEHKATPNIDLNLEELDDQEFEIPAVETPPTLESILNEPDDEQGFGGEEFLSNDLLQGDPGDTGSISSQDGFLESRTRRRPKKNILYEKHGSILRHVILKGVSAQIQSASDRVDAGMPTALAVASLIAIGTSHGLVLVFDPRQVLKWCLGSTAVGSQYGAVSALSFNKDCSRLICGFAKGQMTMWDLNNGKLLRTISDAHPPGTAVLHVKFTDDLTIAVCSDSGGSVFELEMKRLIGVRTCESRCLFSGSRGEVCIIEPLRMHHTVPDHPMKDVIILAMASLTKVLIVTVRPHLKVIYIHPVKGDQATLPLLAWQFVIIQVSERDRVVDPVLAFARDQTIYFAQVFCSNAENIKVSPLQKTELEYKILSITWMNSRTMIALDTSERAHVIDVRTEEELEVIDIGDVQLVYSTSFYKSLATGGNVSKALAFAGERACYQSLVTFNGQLVLLGTKGIHVMTLRNWQERLDVLLKQEKYKEALVLAQSFYEGRAKAVVGLPGSAHKRKQVVADKMFEILQKFVDVSMTKLSPKHGKVEELDKYYQEVVPVCVDYSLFLERTDILFGEIYDRFSHDAMARGTFLECLEPYILSDRLSSITPSVMKDLVDHYQQNGLLQNVEACIVHMDIATLDIHQVVNLCWAHGLYDAILYIYNRGMMDYVTPLEELLQILRAALDTGKQLSDGQIKLGNKLLVYISCCLAGRAYPLGDIPDEHVSRVKDDVFKCVSCLHTKDHSPDENVYPHLKTLLQFDTREFFNVLALAFEEAEFQTEKGLEKKQRVVDILLQIMVESVGFSPTQIGILFTFLARQLARRENSIIVNRTLFEQVLESLCCTTSDTSRHEERQQALLELLSAGGLKQFDEDRLLKLAENAGFFRVCEMLFEKRREFDKILACYWKDAYRKHQAFDYIQYVMNEMHFSLEEKQKVKEEALKHVKELVAIDSKKTAHLVLTSLSGSLPSTVEQLQDDSESLYDFLRGVFKYRDSSSSAIYSDRHIQIEPHIHDMYIELMAKFQPDDVYKYICQADGYQPEVILEICRKYKLSEAVAFLLERTGDIQGAFNILYEHLQSKMQDLVAVLGGLNSEMDSAVCWDKVLESLHMVIQLCQRNSPKLDEVQRESLWFPILEACMAPQRQLKDRMDSSTIEAFKEITRLVLNSMMGYIALTAILQKIMQDPAYSTGRFGEVKELLLGMLDTYNYEKTLLQTCNRLVNHDLHRQLAALTAAANRGIVLRLPSCNLCNKLIVGGDEPGSVIGFRCGHGYHMNCLRALGSRVILDGEETWLCFLCNKTRRGRTSSTSRILRVPSSGPSTGLSGNGNNVTSAKAVSGEVQLEPEQVLAIDNLRKAQKSPSRLAILTELAKQDRGAGPSRFRPGHSESILHNETFQLQLAPPPPEQNS